MTRSILGYIEGNRKLERKAQGILRFCLETYDDFFSSFTTLVFGTVSPPSPVIEEQRGGGNAELRYDLCFGARHVELKCWASFTANQVADLRSATPSIDCIVVPAARVAEVTAKFPSVRVVSWRDIDRAAAGSGAEPILRGINAHIEFGHAPDSGSALRELRNLSTGGAGTMGGQIKGALEHVSSILSEQSLNGLTEGGWSIDGNHGTPYYGYLIAYLPSRPPQLNFWIGFYLVCGPTPVVRCTVYLEQSSSGQAWRLPNSHFGANGELVLWDSTSNYSFNPVVAANSTMRALSAIH